MGRDRIQDFLQVGNFHVMDVSPAIPPVLIPLFGFARCTAPEVTLDMYRIKEGNYEWARKVVKGADAQPITLEQGVSILNSDFGDWFSKSVVGRVDPRDLMIVHFTKIGFAGGGSISPNLPALSAFPTEFVRRIPGRAWLLSACRPSGYKAASDFDGLSQDISIATLTLEYEELTEISLGV